MNKELDFSSYKDCVIMVHNVEQARDVATSAIQFCRSEYSAEAVVAAVELSLKPKGSYETYCLHFIKGDEVFVANEAFYASVGIAVIDFDDFPAVEEPIDVNDIGELI